MNHTRGVISPFIRFGSWVTLRMFVSLKGFPKLWNVLKIDFWSNVGHMLVKCQCVMYGMVGNHDFFTLTAWFAEKSGPVAGGLQFAEFYHDSLVGVGHLHDLRLLGRQ